MLSSIFPFQEERKKKFRHATAEGLRGFAALNVVLCHFVAHFMPNLLSRNYPHMFPNPQSPRDDTLVFKIAQSPLVSLFYSGHFAVSIFFALSGYVLALPWHQNGVHQSLQSSSLGDKHEGDTIQGQMQAYRTIRRRLWGRFLRLHIPAAASMAFAYALQLAGAYNSRKTNLRPEITAHHWERIPGNVPFAKVVQALLGGELLLGTVEVNPVLWTLKLEFWGSVVLLLYTLAVEPRPPMSPCPLDFEHAQTSKHSLTVLSTSLVSSRSPRSQDRRTWWLRSIVTLSFTVLLVASVCDAETTLVIALMLLGAHVPSMPRVSNRIAWCFLAAAAYLGAFQYDRGMFFSSKNISAHQEGAARHPATYLMGGRLQSKHVFNSAGALLAVFSIVHNGAAEMFFSSPLALFLGRVSFPVYMVHSQANISLGGLFLWLPETVFGSSAVPYMVVFLLYIFATYGLASTIFLTIDEKAISVSRAFTTWIA